MTLSDPGPYPGEAGHDEAVALDSTDSLNKYRNRFVRTDPELIYLDGNSLGRMPNAAADIVNDVVSHQWGDRLIRSWNEGWWELHLELGELLAPVIGAGPGQVMISDSTSVNLYKLATAAVAARPGRTKIVTDDLNFPTDVYVLGGIASREQKELVVVPSNGIHGPIEDLSRTIDENTAVVSLSHTTFKSGYTYDMPTITRVAHDSGALVLWDCSHSVGAVPVDLDAAGVDLAVGCTYKYLNGGPGSPAWLYVRSELQEKLENPIAAWWGHAEPFSFDLDFRPVAGIRRFHTGTMPVLSLAAIEAGISDVAEAGIHAIRAKSRALGEYLLNQYETHLRSLGFGLGSPVDAERRGSHVSLTHQEAWPMTRALVEVANVIPDFRVPDSIRFGLSPLYTSFVDVHTALQRLRIVAEEGLQARFVGVTKVVT